MPFKIGHNKIVDYKQHILNNIEMIPESGCWIWMKGCNKLGYGNLGYEGKIVLAHRLAYQLFIGPIPDDKPLICHHCDIPSCVNPHHLFPGTNQINTDDKMHKNRQSRLKGEAAGRAAKLTEIEVLTIRDQYCTGNYTQKQLALAYNMSLESIHLIINRKRWTHI